MPLIILWAVAAGSCAAMRPSKTLGIPPVEPREFHIADVPFFPAEGMRCGPAVMASVLAYYGMDADPDEIAARVMESEETGTYHQRLYLYALGRGMAAQMYSGGVRDLKKTIAMGRPVIILLDYSLTTEPNGHYVLVVGYDEDHFYLYDGTEKNRKVSRRFIYGTWLRTDFFSLLVLPPGTELPVTSADLIRDALAAENDGRWEEAERLYRLALERDELNIGAIIGVGNARLYQDDPAGAVQWYRLALRNNRHRSDARINMAAAFLKLGKTGKAERIIKGVLRKTDDFTPYALDTLGDICRAQGRSGKALEAYRAALENPPPDDKSFLQNVRDKIDSIESNN